MGYSDLARRLIKEADNMQFNEDLDSTDDGIALMREGGAAISTLLQRVDELEVIRDSHSRDTLSALLERDGARKEAARAETLLEEARRALEPFIRLADNVFSDGKNATVADEVTLWCFNDTDITFGDLRRARATLDRIGK